MPVNLPNNLPATETLKAENIFVITQKRAQSQDIRPLEIGIVNLMPTKIATETQLLRLLSNTPLQIEITLIQMRDHVSLNISQEHLRTFYHTFDEIRNKHFDGMIITGAPVELLPFESVDYWNELCRLMNWTKTHVFSTFHICWAAQAALYYHYGIEKHLLGNKVSGIFEHKVMVPESRLMRGFDLSFKAPHSRRTTVHEEDLLNADLTILAKSNQVGVYIAASKNRRQIFVTGHSEYDALTLDTEYRRDIAKGLDIEPPVDYYQNNNPENPPEVSWKAHAYLLFSNWLNYYVYQETPYFLTENAFYRQEDSQLLGES